jgi:hypothetical protein
MEGLLFENQMLTNGISILWLDFMEKVLNATFPHLIFIVSSITGIIQEGFRMFYR